MILPANVADWPEPWAFLFAERAAIMEFQGNLIREEAERCAEIDIRRQASEAHQHQSQVRILER